VKLSCNECHKVLNTFKQERDYYKDLYNELCKRYNEEIEALRQAIRINPENADTWYVLALAYALSGNQTAALNAVRELRRLDPEHANELFNMIVPR